MASTSNPTYYLCTGKVDHCEYYQNCFRAFSSIEALNQHRKQVTLHVLKQKIKNLQPDSWQLKMAHKMCKERKLCSENNQCHDKLDFEYLSFQELQRLLYGYFFIIPEFKEIQVIPSSDPIKVSIIFYVHFYDDHKYYQSQADAEKLVADHYRGMCNSVTIPASYWQECGAWTGKRIEDTTFQILCAMHGQCKDNNKCSHQNFDHLSDKEIIKLVDKCPTAEGSFFNIIRFCVQHIQIY